jgi:hypothetical protein
MIIGCPCRHASMPVIARHRGVHRAAVGLRTHKKSLDGIGGY